MKPFECSKLKEEEQGHDIVLNFSISYTNEDQDLASNLSSCIVVHEHKRKNAISELKKKDQILSVTEQKGKNSQLMHDLEITYQTSGFSLF